MCAIVTLRIIDPIWIKDRAPDRELNLMRCGRVGIRKPDPEIYRMTCEQMSIQPEQTIYLDDLGINLKPARALGMTTIKVRNADQALDELETLLDMQLR